MTAQRARPAPSFATAKLAAAAHNAPRRLEPGDEFGGIRNGLRSRGDFCARLNTRASNRLLRVVILFFIFFRHRYRLGGLMR